MLVCVSVFLCVCLCMRVLHWLFRRVCGSWGGGWWWDRDRDRVADGIQHGVTHPVMSVDVCVGGVCGAGSVDVCVCMYPEEGTAVLSNMPCQVTSDPCGDKENRASRVLNDLQQANTSCLGWFWEREAGGKIP